MAYDYAGASFSKFTAHTANVALSSSKETTPFNTQEAIALYKSSGATAHQIVLGMPLYERDFVDTDGLGSSFQSGGVGSWEPGSWDYKVCPHVLVPLQKITTNRLYY